MSIEYSNAKTSFHIEEQLPSFVRSNGQNFIDFMKTYYDWLEKRFLVCYLKSEYDFTVDEIIGQNLTLSAEHFLLTSEDGQYILTPESHSDFYSIIDHYSILFDGIQNYGDVSASLITLSNSWSMSLWIKPNANPNYLLQDFDVVTLGLSTYKSALKIRKADNKFGFNLKGVEVALNVEYRQDVWQYISIRYNSTTKTIHYDIYNDLGIYSQTISLDLSSSTSDRFVIGCDLYNSRNFYSGYIDEVATWNIFLSDQEVSDNYNLGNPIDLLSKYAPYSFNSLIYTVNDSVASFNQSSGGSITLTNYFRFENNSTYTVLNLAGSNNMTLYHNPTYSIDVPSSLDAIISENEILQSLSLKVVSAIKLENSVEGILGNRMLAFCEHIKGVPVVDEVVFTTNQNIDIFIDSFTDIRNPLCVINNMSKYNEIDYALKYDNFVYDQIFINFWNKIMDGFPLYFHETFDLTIKDIIAKNITDFYRTKGTFESFKYFFKILYDEDIAIGTDIYSDNTFSYVINANNAETAHVRDYIKRVVHPVGFNMTLNLKT